MFTSDFSISNTLIVASMIWAGVEAEGPAKYFVFPNLPNELRNKIHESIAEEQTNPCVIFPETAGKNGVHYHAARPNGNDRPSGTDLSTELQFKTVALFFSTAVPIQTVANLLLVQGRQYIALVLHSSFIHFYFLQQSYTPHKWKDKTHPMTVDGVDQKEFGPAAA
jgi:hypothetical protein